VARQQFGLFTELEVLSLEAHVASGAGSSPDPGGREPLGEYEQIVLRPGVGVIVRR
jgi:hypothetical protein